MSVILDLKQSLGLISPNSLIESDDIPQVEASWHIQIEDLELGECIGSGEFGEVFFGNYLGTEVAIKKMNIEAIGKDNMTKYIKRELECSKFSHPHIVGFIGVGEDVDRKFIYLVTEKLECSLRDVLKNSETKELPWSNRINFALDAAKSLAFLHAKKIIHRDIKSKNLLIDENMKLKICDFGFARKCSTERRRMTICGTDEWMAPEVVLGEEYNQFADVFSYGIVLFEIITRKKVKTHFPRYPRTFFVIDIDHMESLIPSDCPSKLKELAFSCCETEPENRPNFRDIINSLNVIRAELQLIPCTGLQKSIDDDRRALLSPRRTGNPAQNKPLARVTAKPRCSFTDLNELAVTFDNELEIEKILLERFGVNKAGSWVVIGYYDKTTLGVQGQGDGGIEEMVEVLANDEVQYCLVRVHIEEKDIDKPRDVFIFWSGPMINIVQRGKYKTHLGCVQKILRPFHATLYAYNRDLLTEDVVIEKSEPLSGSHVIE